MKTETQEFFRLEDYKGNKKAMEAISWMEVWLWDMKRVYNRMVEELGDETTDEEIGDYLEYITDYVTFLQQERDNEDR